MAAEAEVSGGLYCEHGKSWTRKQKVTDLTLLYWEEGGFDDSSREKQANVRQHPKVVKMVEETTGGKLTYSCLEAPK